MRKYTLLSAALILGPAAAIAAGINAVTAIEVTDRGGVAEVSIQGSKAPSFTTFSLVDPPRFVVDLSEAGLEGVKRKISGAGAVKEVNAISFGEGTHATARVTVTFIGVVEPPDVVVAGNRLVLRVQPSPGVMVAAAPVSAPPPVTAPPPPPVPVLAAAPAEAPAVAAAPPPPAPAPAAVAAPAAVTAPAAVAATVDATAAAAEAKAAAEARAAADAKAAADAAAIAEARAAADARAVAEARAAADAKAAAEVRAAADAKAAADAAAIAEARAAFDAKTAAEARALADAKAAAEVRAADDARPVAPASASKAAPAPAAAKPAPVAKPAPPERNEVEFVGFKQTATGSRVFIRLRSPPRFSVSEPQEMLVRVELPNTRVPLRNDLKALDTSFFPTAVAKVTPVRQGKSYVLEIRLRERVAWQQRIDGTTLSLDFDRPTAPPAAARPALPAKTAVPATPGK